MDLAEQIHFLTGEHKAFQTNESGILQSLASKSWKGCRKKYGRMSDLAMEESNSNGKDTGSGIGY